MASAHDVAKFFLTLADDEAGDLISNLKLQKLLYYAQGFHLAVFDAPLFNANIKAWEHGPVVPEVWHAYRDAGASAIPRPSDFDANALSDDQQGLLREVYETYGQFSAWKLRNMTHEEAPWRATPRNGDIPPTVLKEYFETQIQ